MPAIETSQRLASARALTVAAYACFIPIGVVTVLLGPLLPTLSTKWALDYSQAGALFTAQFLASTVAVGISGVLVSRFGFRFAIKAGLALMSLSVALLLAGSRIQGMVCIAGYGAGLGLAVPAANLLVAEVNPDRRSSALNILNFCWSVGAVACPFLIAAAIRSSHITLLLVLVAAISLAVAVGIWAMPASIVEPVATRVEGSRQPAIAWKGKALYVLAALFFIYVGTENSFGGWVASYAKSLGTLSVSMAIMTPSFFYASLTLGRLFAPAVLRAVDEVKLAQAGVLMACAGMAGLLISYSLPMVIASNCLAGLGLSSVYPITISLLSREFGSATSRVGSLMFTMANLGGSCLPWLVGVSSSQFYSLKAGLAIPLMGAGTMFFLYLRDWKTSLELTA